MSSVLFDRLFASSSARLATIYSALLLVAFLFAGGVAWFATKGAAEHQTRERIQLEMNALQEEMRLEGMPAAIAAIRTRSESPGALEYLLADARGGVLIGDLRVQNVGTGWNLLDLPGEASRREGDADYIVLSASTPGGGRLVIGDDLAHAERVRAAVLSSILWVGGVALLLALIAGTFAARMTGARMDAISRSLAAVAAGDLSARAPERLGGDDIDEIGRGINQMLTRIDTLVASVRRVSTDIAHDLRTPLAHIRQELETVESADPVRAQEAIVRAQSQIDGLLRTFAAMLRLAEIEAGGGRSRFETIDLASTVERVADAYRPDIEAGGRTFTVGLLRASPIVGDADLIAQALANLLENALRHTSPGKAITVRLENDLRYIGLVVEDGGQGIAPGERARVLEPFVRLDGSRGGGGSGLGLSIVHAIANLHGAQLILADADPGLRVSLIWRK